jgi:hypothetical protein
LDIPSRVYEESSEAKRLQARDIYKGRDYDIVALPMIPDRSGSFSTAISEARRRHQRQPCEPVAIGTQDLPETAAGRDPRILNSLFGHSTEMSSTPVPRGPFAGSLASMTFQRAFTQHHDSESRFSLPEQTFIFLRNPNITLTGTTLFQKAGSRFTETLVSEVVGRLRSANSNGGIRSTLGQLWVASPQERWLR